MSRKVPKTRCGTLCPRLTSIPGVYNLCDLCQGVFELKPVIEVLEDF